MPSYFRVGGEFAVNQVTTNNQTGVRVANLPGNRYIVVWSSDAAVANQADIVARIFNSDGTPAGPEFVVNSQLVAHQATPDVVALSNGNFVVTWVDYNASSDGDNTCIKAQIFDSNGVPIGGEFLVNVATAGRQDSAEVTALSNGGFVITWDDTPTTDQFGRVYDASGQPTSGAIRLNTNLNLSQGFGEVIGLNNGNFLVVWRTTDTTADGNSFALKAQIFDPAGNKLGSEFLVNTAGFGSQTSPAIAVLSNGNFVVAWQTSDTAQDGSSSAIKAQLFAADGTKIGGEFLVNSQGQDLQNSPTITALADGGYFIAWFTNDPNQDGNLGAVKGQFFTASGVRVGGEILLNTVTTGSQSQPAIAANPDGSIMVTWVTQAVSFGETNIRAQIFHANDAPVITSNGGGDTAAVNVAEGNVAITQITATDSYGTQAVGYTIVGGADAALFVINAATGALSFATAPDFETPGDSDGNNVYQVIVQASDGELTDTQTIAVTITNVNEAPAITSDGGGVSAAIALNENVGAVTVVAASDADGPALSFAIVGGADAALFAIDPATGVLSFIASPNFEAPADADLNNIYEVVVSASDGSLVDTQALSINIANVNEALVFPATGSFTIAENQQAVGSVLAFDPDGAAISYTISGGADAALFGIDAATGALTFLSAPNFEAPGDAGADNVYDVEITASDGVFNATQTVNVNVTNINEGPVFTSFGGGASVTTSVAENSLFAGVPAAVDPEGGYVSYAITGGADASRFTLNPGSNAITFLQPANFEAAGDADGDNVYELIVSATDEAGNSSTQTVFIQVTDVNEAPVFTSHGGNFVVDLTANENSTYVTSIAAVDPEGQALSYSIWGGTDASRFSVDAVTGQLSFVATPDFENPVDANGDNIYSVAVAVTDGTNLRFQNFNITIGNVNEAPVITSNGGGANAAVTVNENQLAVTTVASTDPDANPLSYSIVGGADAVRFTINAATGALAFVNAPNFEAPGSANLSNVYDVIVQASDGTLTDTQAIAVTVANVNEAPVFAGGASAAVQHNENNRLVNFVNAADPDGNTLTYSIVGGADAALFGLTSNGLLTFNSAPNHEAPGDVGANNVYDIVVRASDGVNITTQTLQIVVNNVVDGVTINGTSGANTLTGTNAEDTIDGLGGNDVITGGLGADRLFGGSGADRFVYNSVLDSRVGSTFNPVSGANVSNMDSIRDFSRSQGDKISLSGIDANSNAAGDQAFSFIGTAAFSNVAGQLRYTQVNGTTVVSGDVNGDGVADFAIELNGPVNLQSSDFIL